MAVLDSNQTVSNNTSGFDKGIHASARTMMLDNLQALMYQKPIQSAVRECVSNAVDAVKEKITARKIKSGEAKVSDFYLTREDVKDKIAKDADDIYQDSEFDPDYYDLKYFDNDNTVKLEYITNEQTKRDLFTITDPGVGLGGKRLEGFFSLGYSSKRLNTNELGGFGLGAKSPLATGVESYRILTRYNGKEFCFDIYSHKVDCVYGKWGDGGKANNFVEFKSVLVPEKYTETVVNDAGDMEEVSGTRMVPYKAYYQDTDKKNGTTVSMEVKKHNRHQYFDAVNSQLMYLKADITFTDVALNGYKQDVPFKASPIHEDDDLVLSDYGYYSRPHFVIKGVSYGLIDFNEADLAVKHGNIGIKFNMEDLDVVPSRESVRYTPKTTQAIISKYASVARTVEAKIQKELKQDKLIDWIRACNKILYSSSRSTNDVISRMSQLTDSTSLSPTFMETDIKYTSDIKTFITPVLMMQHVLLERGNNWSSRKQTKKILRTDNQNILAFDKPLYFQFGSGNNRVSHYLAAQHEREGGFCVFRVATSLNYLEPLFNDFVTNKLTKADFKEKAEQLVEETETDDKKIKNVLEQLKKAIELVNYMKNGKGDGMVNIYGSQDIPDSFKITEEDDTEEVAEDEVTEEDYEEQRKNAYKETLKRRRASKTFIGYKLANKYNTSYNSRAAWSRGEIKGDEIDFDATKVIYTTDDDGGASDCLINITEYANRDQDSHGYYYWNDALKIMKVAKSNLRYVKEGTTLPSYLLGVKDGVLFGNDYVKKIFTSRIITKLIGKKCDFMRNFGQLNQEIADSYEKLYKFTSNSGSGRALSKDTIGSNNIYANFLNKHYEVQLIILENPSLDEEAVQELIDECHDKTLDIDILGIDLIDKELYEEAKKLVAFSEVYGGIFNYISPLHDNYKSIVDSTLVSELKVILESKKDQLEYQYEGLNK